ncbi:hypothetical protein [Paenibacillus sp. PL2-23]|uniref:hypothetical protein n=1 Tax=Paenibacillus sp. PL2-23 TaxID=2100729 RepID=UPI0030FC949E
MTTWQGAWYLAKEELRRTRWKHILTLIFIGYLCIFLVPMFADGMEGEDLGMVYWAIDFITLSLLPCLGLMSTQTFGNYWKTDTYTKKLAAWRTMPIRVDQIVLGRILTMLMILIPALILFFIIFFLAGQSLTSEIEIAAFIPFAIFWIGYSIMASIVYVYVEIGYSGKFYFWFCMLITFLFLFGMIVTVLLLESSLFVQSYRLAADGGWWLAIIGMISAIAAIGIGRSVLEKRLRMRSYTS